MAKSNHFFLPQQQKSMHDFVYSCPSNRTCALFDKPHHMAHNMMLKTCKSSFNVSILSYIIKTGNTTNSLVSHNILTNHTFNFQNSATIPFIHDKNKE